MVGNRKTWSGKWTFANEHIWSERGDPDLTPDRKREIGAVNSVILHTTGRGPGLRRLHRKFWDKDPAIVDARMALRQANLLEYKPHGSVGYAGGIYQFAPCEYRTHHTAGAVGKARWIDNPDRWPKKVRVMDGDGWINRRTDWWPDVFPNLDSPLGLPCWQPIVRGNRVFWSPNHHSVGVDLIEPPQGVPYSEAQLDALAYVVAVLTVDLDIVCDFHHVIDHSRAAPLERSNRRGPWDLDDDRFSWPKFWERLADNRAQLGHNTVPYGETVADTIDDHEVDPAKVNGLLVRRGFPVDPSDVWTDDAQAAVEALRREVGYCAHAKWGPTSTDLYVLQHLDAKKGDA